MLKHLIVLISLLFFLLACQSQQTVLPTFTPVPRASSTPQPATPTLPSATLVPYATLPPAQQQPNPRAEPAQVWVIQANPAFDSVDIYAGLQVIGARLAFGVPTAQSLDLPSGLHQVSVVDKSTGARVLEDELTLKARESYVLLFYGDAAAPKIGLFPYDRSPLDPNTSRLQVLNAVTGSSDFELEANGLALLEGIAYEETLAPLELPSSNYEFNLLAGGGSLEKADYGLQAQQSYFFLILGNPDLGKFETLLLSQATLPRTLFRVIHAALDVPALRVWLDEFVVIEDLEYRDFSDRFIPFNSGLHKLRVESMDGEELLDQLLELPPNRQAELVFYGRTLQARLFPLQADPVSEGEARLSIINALPLDQAIRPEVSTQLFDANNRLSALQFGESSPTVPISAGLQTFQFWLDTSFFYETDSLPIQSETLYTYVMLGRNGRDSLLLSLPLAKKEADAEEEDIPEDDAPTTARFINATRSQEAIQVLVDGESLSLAYGFISDPLALPAEKRLDLQVSGGANFSESYFSEGGINTTLVITDELIVINETGDWMQINRGAARGFFVNALPRRESITLSFRPTAPLVRDVLTNPDVEAGDDLLYDVGNQVGRGQFEVIQMPFGNFTLQVNEGATGRTLGEVFLEADAPQNYYYIILPDGTGLQLLTVVSDLAN